MLVSFCTIDLREWGRLPDCNETAADKHNALFAENRLEYRGKRTGARLENAPRGGLLPIADLTASNPTRCGFKYDSLLLTALADPRALNYDPQPRGLLKAREAVCDYYAGHGVALDPAQIVLTTSTSEAYSFLFRLLCDPGNEIVVLQPGYPLFDFLAGLDDVHLKAAPLIYDHGWQIDAEGIRRAVTSRTRAVVVVHPNNPTGHFSKPWEAEELARICRQNDLSLIVDEVFLDYGFGGRAANFALGLDGVPVFVVSGLSKIAGLPQMKAAWIAATGPERGAALDRLEVIADTFLSMNAPVQWAPRRGSRVRRSFRRRSKIRQPRTFRFWMLDWFGRWPWNGWRRKAAGMRSFEFPRSNPMSRPFWRSWNRASGFILVISSA